MVIFHSYVSLPEGTLVIIAKLVDLIFAISGKLIN